MLVGLPLFLGLLVILHVLHTATMSLFMEGRLRLIDDAERALIKDVGWFWGTIGVLTFPIWVWGWLAFVLIRALRGRAGRH